MAGLLAWAADVVGGHHSNDEDEESRIPIVFTPEQQRYAQELDYKAAALSRAIQDLRLRLPPPDISHRLPDLHAHSLASNAALALQLNAHSATRHQVQLREETLQQENAAYEKAISACKDKILEKVQEADSLRIKLKEMETIERSLKSELQISESHSERSEEAMYQPVVNADTGDEAEASKADLLDKLENQKKELRSMEKTVQDLEEKWAAVQNKALQQPSPVQREKALDKQLHSLIEQLAAKQAQAEGLIGDIHMKEMELEELNGLWRKVEVSNSEASTARNRFGRGHFDKASSSDFSVYMQDKLPYYAGNRNENQHKLMLLRSMFVLYILVLHILVFIKISF